MHCTSWHLSLPHIASQPAFAGCRSGFGVFDMSGNVAEWTATPLSAGSRAMIVKGGAANKPDWAVRCANRGIAIRRFDQHGA